MICCPVITVLYDLIINSPNYTSFCKTTVSPMTIIVDVMIWLDACSPMTAIKLRIYDHYLVFFPDGSSKPLDLQTYIGTEHSIHQVLVVAIVCAILKYSINIYFAFSARPVYMRPTSTVCQRSFDY